MVLYYILISVVAVSLLSLAGAGALILSERVLRKLLLFLVAFSAGALIGDSFIHLLPEMAEGGEFTLRSSNAILAGILVFFALEKFLRWRHCHDLNCPEHPKHLGSMNLFADGLHNLIDGLLIGSSYLVSLPLGLTTTIAVALHEIPQELGDFGVLLHSGFSVRRAIGLNFVSAALAIVGALIAYAVGQGAGDFVLFMVPFTIGSFVYIALSGLFPELHKENEIKKSFWQFMAIILGIGVMYSLIFIE
ncbi:MAG: ZIP family metal transporter [Patescibacteria group bacterium]